MMKKLIVLFLIAIVWGSDIEVSQDTLYQTLNFGNTTERIITVTNNTANPVDLTVTLVDQTWIPPLARTFSSADIDRLNDESDLGFSQDHICGTPDPTSEQSLISLMQVEQWLQNMDRSSRSIINVQIAWHVIHADNGEGLLTSSQIEAQVAWLNYAFADFDFIFTLSSVDYTENNDWFYNMYDLDSQVKYALNIDPVHHMNVYTAAIFSDGVAGYAYLPNQWNENSHNHGIVLDYRTLPYAAGYDGDVAVHETGHYLGLHHTFNNNCTTGNDGVDDTPAHHEDYLWQCNNNLDSCPTLSGNDPVHNYMTYTSNSCQWEFTLGQKDRMHAMVSTYRPGLLENPVAPEWLSTANENVTVPANSSTNITFTFNATNTYGGLYFGDIIFTAETPDTSITVSTTLNVIGSPEIGFITTALSFDETFINDTSTVILQVLNVGSDDLLISSLEYNDDHFFSETSAIWISPSESEEITISFVPDSIGAFIGTLTLYSNDASDSSVQVVLYGNGLESPLLFSFSALTDTVEPNAFVTHILTISNSSSESLDFTISHDIEWLTISPVSGTVSAFNNANVQFNINTLFMNFGDYSGVVHFSTPVGNFTVNVNITVGQLAADDEILSLPKEFRLYENYPNPFNPVTNFRIDVPEKGIMNISILNINGKLIRTLFQEVIEPGSHQFSWDGKNNLGDDASSGVYLLNINQHGKHLSQKLLLVK